MRRPAVLVALAIVLAAAGSGWVNGAIPDADAPLFAWAGTTMLSADWQHTFDNHTVQAGPFELALASVAMRAGGSQRGFAVALDVAGAVCVLLAGWALRLRARALSLLGAGAFLIGLLGDAYVGGHPAELAIPFLWLLAAREARAGRTVIAGSLVGASAGWEIWGLLGVAVLALSPQLRRVPAGALAAAALGTALFLPFVLAGDFHMFEYHWYVGSGLEARLLGKGHSFTWPMRLAEGAVVVAVGTVVARATRRLGASVWLVPVAVSLSRLALDPVLYPYYWDTPLLMLLAGAAGIVAAPRQLAASIAGSLSAAEHRERAQGQPRHAVLLARVRQLARQ